MAMTFLKKSAELMPGGSLKYLLHSHLSVREPARTLSRVHASELTKEAGFCPRFYALHDATKAQQKDGWLSTSQNITYHIGRVLQDSVVHWFADMQKAVGHWKCVGCGTMHEFQLRPSKCATCGVRSFDPVEVRFTSDETGASAGIDMLVKLSGTKLTVCELKTMAPEQFKTLVAPLAEHRLRTNLYLRIIAESGHSFATLVNQTEATILYISKGGYGCADPQLKKWGLKEGFSPFKEYVIKRNDAETDDLMRRAKVVKDHREGKVGMPVGICPTAFSKRASTCPRKAECFGGDYPPQYDWTK